MSQKPLISAGKPISNHQEEQDVQKVEKAPEAPEAPEVPVASSTHASDRETLLNLWQTENPRSFRILNAKKLEVTPEVLVLENLSILGFNNFTVNDIQNPLTHSMSSKSGAISLSFSTTSELADQVWEFLKDPEYEKKIIEANRAEFGRDLEGYVLLTGNLRYHDFKEFAFVKDCMGEILKMDPGIQDFQMSHSTFTIGAGEPKSIKDICKDHPEIAKQCWQNLTPKGRVNVEFIAKRGGIPKSFWK